ncbi:MAG: hypothetical protein SFU56_16695 [Capsulimonadales bacterium]|nr:hypothetical protein [Capsulimonadales bacterium]
MQLTLRDIGEERFVTVLGRSVRAIQGANNAHAATPNATLHPPFPGKLKRAPRRLARFWTRKLDLPEEAATRLADQIWTGPYGASLKAFSFVFLFHMALAAFLMGIGTGVGVFIGVFFLFLWTSIIGGMVWAPRVQLTQIAERDLTVEDIEALLPNARGRLERQYFGLVLDALRTEIPSESAKSDIRAALRHLGDAIARLPSDPVATPDADILRREAQGLRMQANRETDAFVESSLLRQAEMLEQRATLAAQNGRSARRIAMLRREARTQMDSLRSVLVGFQQAQQSDVVAISQLSSALQRVSGEAKAVALARQELENEELERMYGAPLPVPNPVTTPAVQPVRPNNPGPTGPMPAPPASGNRGPWWRNNNGV